MTSRPLAHVPADAFVYLAIARMSRLKIRHLGVTDERHDHWALSARDLLRSQARHELLLRDEIDEATSVAELARTWAELPAVVARPVGGGCSRAGDRGFDLARHPGAHAACRGPCRREHAANWKGDPPCGYALAVLGSAGRGESLLALDQDNALVFASGAPDGVRRPLVRRAFSSCCRHPARRRNSVLQWRCHGEESDWRGSVATWHGRIGIGSADRARRTS